MQSDRFASVIASDYSEAMLRQTHTFLKEGKGEVRCSPGLEDFLQTSLFEGSIH